MEERRSDFSNRSAVTSELHVGGEERDFFDKRLGDQKAIEGIFVKRRQSLDIDGMFAGDRELDVAIVEESTPENARLDPKIISAEGALYRDLPKAGGAEEKLVFRITKFSFRPC